MQGGDPRGERGHVPTSETRKNILRYVVSLNLSDEVVATGNRCYRGLQTETMATLPQLQLLLQLQSLQKPTLQPHPNMTQ